MSNIEIRNKSELPKFKTSANSLCKEMPFYWFRTFAGSNFDIVSYFVLRIFDRTEFLLIANLTLQYPRLSFRATR